VADSGDTHREYNFLQSMGCLGTIMSVVIDIMLLGEGGALCSNGSEN
jgi:hypothetical protein